jgi:hypothetical protein
MKRLIYLVLVVMLVAVACGDDDATTTQAPTTTEATTTTAEAATTTEATTPLTEDEFADALVAAILADESLENPLQDPDDAQCAVDGLMDTFGMDRLIELGITPDAEDLLDLTTTGAGMTEDEQEAFLDIYFSCVDAVAAMGDALTAGGIPAADAQCLATTLGEDFVRAIVGAELAGEAFDPLADPAAAAGFETVVTSCISDPGVFMGDVMAAAGLPQETADCIAAGLTEEMAQDLLPAFLASALSGAEFDVAAYPELLTLVTTCMTGG